LSPPGSAVGKQSPTPPTGPSEPTVRRYILYNGKEY
jgi:hypothetical protein